jgi:acetyltransferase-like isoleucine patch superfamily enzyme
MNARSLSRALHDLATRWKLRRAARIGEGATARGTIWIHGAGTVTIGRGATLDASYAPIELFAREGAEIVIGDGARIEGGASIEARRSVRVGARSRVGRLCKVMDNHFHRVSERDREPPSAPIVIEDDAVLGARSILLPGAHVGRGASVGAATVVARRVPDGAVIAGLPAQVRRAS